MKKIFAALSLVAIMISSCTPEEVINPVTVSLDKESATEMGLVANDKHFHVVVTNGTDKEASIMWERAETQAVTGWTYMVGGDAAASGTLTVPANGSVTVMLVVNPNGMAANGTGMLKFYDAADQATTMKTFSYDLTTLVEYFTVSAPGFLSQSIRVGDPDTDYHLWVINNNTTSIVVNWERTAESSSPSAWQLAVCTDATCYTPLIMAESMTIAPGDSVDFKSTISHNATVGNGGSTPIFYVASDSANSVVNNFVMAHEVTL